jgi:hypothetical protein
VKRLIAAVVVAVSATTAIAEVGAPFEQNELDRMLPPVPDNVASRESVQLAQIGNASYKSDEGTTSVWANDHNFISPAQ